jgi:UDP-N-acetylmuramoylalanine--D-glutamate ligase
MQAYIAAKQNIIRYQQKSDTALLNRLDPEIRKWGPLCPGCLHWYPADNPDTIELSIPGSHNQVNAATALAVGDVFQVPKSLQTQALRNFPGLPHRLELVREVDQVRYYNDSIATTPESVQAAIEAFPEPKVLLLGGYDKGISFRELMEKIVKNPTVEQVILLGAVREKLAAELEQAQIAAQIHTPKFKRADSFDQAVEHARQAARTGMVVLMSPGCASYDMFTNFQQRGNRFRELVAQL